MIKVTKILGNVQNLQDSAKQRDIIPIEWYDVRKKIARWQSRAGRDIAMRLESAPITGIGDGDILYEDENVVVIFEILPIEVLSVLVRGDMQIAQFCYEIGNRHAPLFVGDMEVENGLELLTPYEFPLKKLTEKLNLEHCAKRCKLDSKRRFNVSMPHRESAMKITISDDFSITKK
ncbi:urease accesory protein UreE [Helicobacter mustelae]|uniref:urease accessory protein UreE n=1 Tax=Helicobacter mustelae TaxID=217 RepID=UPI000E0115EF|nr:urease accessory protein UreE [Helicobacter mustelae]STP12211.1 urease accesory protein UreE [Helicobacter mustelae]